MKKTSSLTLAACALMLGSLPLSLHSQETTAAPSSSTAPAKAETAKPDMPDKEKMNAARKQASEDPKVKAAMEAAAESRRQANLLLAEKMKEIDPSLAPALDKEIAKLSKEPKTAAKPDPKAAANPAPAKPDAKKAVGDKTGKDKTAKDKTAATAAAGASTAAKDAKTPTAGSDKSDSSQ